VRGEGTPLRIAPYGSYNVVVEWDDLVETTERTPALGKVRKPVR
jgi:hypothetical protein